MHLSDDFFLFLLLRYMKLLLADFGTDHFYDADGTFSHAAAPWMSAGHAMADPTFRAAAARRQAEFDARAARAAAATAAAGPPPPPPIDIDRAAYNHSRVRQFSATFFFLLATLCWMCVGIRRRRVLPSPVCA